MVQSVIQGVLETSSYADEPKKGHIVLGQRDDIPQIQNDLILRVAREGSSKPNGSNVLGRTWRAITSPFLQRRQNQIDASGTRMAPVWAMRQAGRYAYFCLCTNKSLMMVMVSVTNETGTCRNFVKFESLMNSLRYGDGQSICWFIEWLFYQPSLSPCRFATIQT